MSISDPGWYQEPKAGHSSTTDNRDQLKLMPLCWLVYRHNNQISVVIELGAERGWPVQRTSMLI
jgi:hypothetical protein